MTAVWSAGSEKFMADCVAGGGSASGGPVPLGFSEGWATHPFVGKMKAHHWCADRSFDYCSPEDRRAFLSKGAYGATSSCGIVTVATHEVPLLGPGNLERCKRCDGVRARWRRMAAHR